MRNLKRFSYNIIASIYSHINNTIPFFQTDEEEVITFLLSTEIIPLCLRIMESGTELSKTVATFILQKILLDEKGLSYICQTFERFSHVAIILVNIFHVYFYTDTLITIYSFFFVCDENAITCTLIILFEITLFTNRLFMTVIILHQTPSVIQKTWNNFIYHAFDLKKFIITFFFDSNCLFYEYKQIAG